MTTTTTTTTLARETTTRATIALVTGATRGIGRETVRQLAASGMTVYLGARDPARGERAAAELADAGDVRSLRLDVTDAESITAAVERLEREAGRLDVLVNNAAVNNDLHATGVTPVAEVAADAVRATFDTNVVGLIAVTNALLPLLRRAEAGRIVNMSSAIASLTQLADPTSGAATRRMLAYAASKAAVNAITLIYANDLRESGIRVNAADPGFVATDMNDHQGVLTVEQGAAVPVRLAAGRPDGPGGEFIGQDGQAVPW
ncbi:SDR family oxidoreductase [Frankia sp. QA3]|uniref:SDR family oxidoreductase n=1 Tax=Frankia sp. QA3 TaxID=710111 RepID=UPI000269BED6|nr:SDR family oxidoreductase [Frankia sp. QA3]EIV92383.1 short-chain dehydrogenase of unknown substrate specificity [Frankia sp. QA3]